MKRSSSLQNWLCFQETSSLKVSTNPKDHWPINISAAIYLSVWIFCPSFLFCTFQWTCTFKPDRILLMQELFIRGIVFFIFLKHNTTNCVIIFIIRKMHPLSNPACFENVMYFVNFLLAIIYQIFFVFLILIRPYNFHWLSSGNYHGRHGSAELSNVEVKHYGQYGWNKEYDPRLGDDFYWKLT